jgi:thymidylate synthase
MMNKLDKQYQDLLQDILDNGVEKKDRTGTGTISVFGRQIRHKMSEGFPLLTTKKMPWKTIVTELLWFLRGDTNIKYLVDNNCHIWDGDAFRNYIKNNPNSDEQMVNDTNGMVNIKDWFINKIKTDDEFAKKWGDLGPIYGKQWRKWSGLTKKIISGTKLFSTGFTQIDQIANLISELKTNPDSRRLMVNAWNVGELDQMVLPPCHYGFQVYTRELSEDEKNEIRDMQYFKNNLHQALKGSDTKIDWGNIPTRAISLMWNQRSVDTFLGLPFNIASYGLLLEIIAKEVNMIPDELIGNLGDVHLYSNHIEQAKEQIGRKYTHEERTELLKQAMGEERYDKVVDELMPFGGGMSEYYDKYKIPYTTREPFPLPKLNFNTEWWDKPFFEAVTSDAFCKCLLEEDIQLGNYQSHPTIKAPLSN